MWEKVEKETHNALKEPFMSIRNSKTLAFNAEFCKRYGLVYGQNVEFYFAENETKMRISLHGHNATADSYKLSKDGGSSSKKAVSLVIQAPSVIKKSQRLLELASSKNKDENRLCPTMSNHNGLEFILIPYFKYSSGGRKPSSGDKGIYRLSDKDGQTVYYGQGSILSRIADHKKNGLEFHSYSYGLLDSKESRIKWESYYISKHKEEHGIIPKYNKIKGVAID